MTLVPYNPNVLVDSVKWTEVMSTGFRVIRIAENNALNMTAVPSTSENKFHDGAKIVVKHWLATPVQRWNIVPYNSDIPD